MATTAEIRDKAAFRLGIKSFGQALENSVSSDLDAAYDEAYALLRADDLVSWGSSADIPSEFVYPVVSLVAFSRMEEYGVGGERAARIAAAATGAERLIRRIIQGDYFNSDSEANYY